MIKSEIVATGATLEEAIENGCNELGIDKDDVKIEILEMPKKRLFGSTPATVRVYVECDDDEEFDETDETEEADNTEDSAEAPENEDVYEDEPDEPEEQVSVEPERKPRPDGVDPAQIAHDYLRSIIDAMGLDGVNIEIKYNEDGSGAVLDLTGDGLGAVIGRRGETLAALQYLVSLATNNSGNEYYRIAINIGNYREKREDSLENLAKKTAIRCLKINRNLALDPMNPYERRIVHTAVQEIDGAVSWSVGDGSKRHVVIGPEGLDEGADGLPVNHSNRSGYNNNRGGYNNRGYNRGYNNRGYNNNRGGYNGGHNYNHGYNSYDNRDGGYNSGYRNRDYYERSGEDNGNSYGGYNNNRSGYNNNRGGYNNRGYNNNRGGYNNRSYNNDGGYRRNNNSYGGGYQKNNSYNRTNDAPQREARKDTAAPLYGRIEVPKKNDNNSEE